MDDHAHSFVIAGADVHGAYEVAKARNNSLSMAMNISGLTQNQDKNEAIGRFRGRGSVLTSQGLASREWPDSFGTTKMAVRYLGPLMAYNGSNKAEVDNRIAATQKAWACTEEPLKVGVHFKDHAPNRLESPNFSAPTYKT